MNRLHQVLLGTVAVAAFAAPALACIPEGDWFHTGESGKESTLALKDDGSYEFDGIRGTWKRDGGMRGKMVFTPRAGDQNVSVTYEFVLAYNGSWEKETLTLSGGNLEQPMVFGRVRQPRRAEPKPRAEPEGGLAAKGAANGGGAGVALLPVNPAASARSGDWAVLAPAAGTAPARVFRISSVDGERVKLKVAQAGKDAREREVTLSSKEAPQLAQLVAELAEAKVGELKVEDERRTIAGKEFETKRVSFTAEKGGQKQSWTIWTSSEVKGAGIVAIAMSANGEKAPSLSLELAGYGNGDRVAWGKRAEELPAERP